MNYVEALSFEDAEAKNLVYKYAYMFDLPIGFSVLLENNPDNDNIKLKRIFSIDNDSVTKEEGELTSKFLLSVLTEKLSTCPIKVSKKDPRIFYFAWVLLQNIYGESFSDGQDWEGDIGDLYRLVAKLKKEYIDKGKGIHEYFEKELGVTIPKHMQKRYKSLSWMQKISKISDKSRAKLLFGNLGRC